MSTDPISLVGWASLIVFSYFYFVWGTRRMVRIYEDRLSQVLTRRGMTIESMNSRARFFDIFEKWNEIEFETTFTTPRGRRIQGVFRLCNRLRDRLRFRTFQFHGRSDRPDHLKKQPKIKKPPRTLFD